MKRTLTNIIAATALALTGCTTAHYTKNSHGKIHPSQLEQSQAPEKSYIYLGNIMPYERTTQVLQKYSDLVPQKLDVIMANTNYTELRLLNLTGPRSASADEIVDIEGSVSNKQHVASLDIGHSDKKLPRSREYQLGNNSLLGIQSFASNPSNNLFRIKIDKTIGVKKNTYDVSLTFGQSQYVADQKTTDKEVAANTLVDAIVGGLATQNPIGAAGFAGHNVAEAGIASFQGRDAPKGTRLVERNEYLGATDMLVARTASAINHARDLNAHTMLIVPYTTSNQVGTAAIYLTAAPENLKVKGNQVKLRMVTQDKDWIKERILDASKALIVLGVHDKHHNNDGGGRTGGPGVGTGGRNGGVGVGVGNR